jgi:hypothetical protein
VEFISSYLGLKPELRLFIISPEELVGINRVPFGGVCVAAPGDFGISGDGFPTDVELARRIGGVWWGGGCRLLGPFAREIESGIRTGLGLLWTEAVGEQASVAKRVEWYRRMARRPRIVDQWYSAQGLTGPGITSRVALAIFDRCRADDVFEQVLARLTQDCWGNYSPSLEAAQALGLTELLAG